MQRRKRISRIFKLHVMEEEEKVILTIDIMSPLVAKVEVIEYGDNFMRNNQEWVAGTEWSKQRTMEPLKRNEAQKARTGSKQTKKKKQEKEDLGKVRAGSRKKEPTYQEEF